MRTLGGQLSSATAEHRERLNEKIGGAIPRQHRTYGYRQIHTALLHSGEQDLDKPIRAVAADHHSDESVTSGRNALASRSFGR